MTSLANATPDPATDKPPRLRRRIPVPLRIFLVTLAIAAVASAAWIVMRGERQRVAVARMQWFYATTTYSPHGPKWLRDWLGDRWEFVFKDVISVDLARTEIGNDDLGQLQALPALKELSLEDAPFITDLGMVHLRGLTSLRELTLGGTQVSDAGLANVAYLTNLTELDLQSTHITDSGLSAIGSLPKLEYLYLTETPITDAGVARLKGLKELAILWLAETRVTDASFAHLKSFPNLFSVSFSGTPVADEGSKYLAELTDLVKLDLSHTRITDATLVSLRNLTNLRFLDISWTQVTDAGVAELHRALPELKIER